MTVSPAGVERWNVDPRFASTVAGLAAAAVAAAVGLYATSPHATVQLLADGGAINVATIVVYLLAGVVAIGGLARLRTVGLGKGYAWLLLFAFLGALEEMALWSRLPWDTTAYGVEVTSLHDFLAVAIEFLADNGLLVAVILALLAAVTLTILVMRDWLRVHGVEHVRRHPSVPWAGVAILLVLAAQVIDLSAGDGGAAALVEETVELLGAIALLAAAGAVFVPDHREGLDVAGPVEDRTSAEQTPAHQY